MLLELTQGTVRCKKDGSSDIEHFQFWHLGDRNAFHKLRSPISDKLSLVDKFKWSWGNEGSVLYGLLMACVCLKSYCSESDLMGTPFR